jgi:hypothetical protein
MARGTPTHEPPDYPDDELLPDEPPPGPRQLLRLFLPIAAAIVVVIVALTLVLKFLVVPAMERSDPAVQARALATIGALQTQEVVTRAEQSSASQPTPELRSTPGPTQALQPAAQPTAVPTAGVAQPQANPAQRTTADQSSAVAQGSTSTSAQATVDNNDTPANQTAATGPLAVPTVDPVAQAEVQQAYARYWTQRTLAFRDLDSSLLNDVAAGPELTGLTSEIEQLRSEGRAISTHVIHHVVALPTAPGEAVVADQYEDLSTYIDFETKEPIDPANADPQSGPVVSAREVLQKIDGVWKVTGGQVDDQ